MRYDKVEAFYKLASYELSRQAEGDRVAGRAQLAKLLEEAAEVAEQQQQNFAHIWQLCKPYIE